MSKVSSCCNAKFKPFHTPFCSACGEHCEEVDLDEDEQNQIAKALEATGWIERVLEV